MYRDCRKGSRRRQAARRQRWCALEALCRSAAQLLRSCKQGYIQGCCRLTSGRDGTGVGGNRSAGVSRTGWLARRKTGYNQNCLVTAR